MHARMIVEMAHWLDDRDSVVVECDGYELEPYSVEVDEHDGKLIIKCYSPEDSDFGPGDDDEEEEEDVTGTETEVPWEVGHSAPSCDMPERPLESLDISDPDPKEG